MKLFERAKIGTMEVRNRIAMAPMGTRGLKDVDGGYSRRLIDFYTARARGGTGMIMTGAAVVNSRLEGGIAHLLPQLTGPQYLDRLCELADAMHHYGSKLVVQLTAGLGRVNFVQDNPIQPISASVVPCFFDPSGMTRALTVEDIAEIVHSFATAAGMAKMAGADALEIQGYGGYLIDQFQSALWNKRTDAYGGDLNGRMRFTMELIAATRQAVGNDFPILYKFTPDHYIPGGRTLDEGLEIARRLEQAGVDALHVDGGCYEVWYRVIPSMYEQSGCQIPLAEAVKPVVKIPVIAHGKLGDPELAQRVVEEGKADFIALGRALLADPDWAKKAKAGRFDDIKPCISCNEGCLRTVSYISCTVNPQVGMESVYQVKPIEQKKSVLVIGGGPAGLEAARVAASRGCEVTLWEKSGELGGKLRVAAVPEFKRDLKPLLRYLTTQVEKAGVTVKLNQDVTVDLVKRQKPDVVIVATGSKFNLPNLPGVTMDHVMNTVQLFEGVKPVGQRVAVIGGGLCGCEAAIYLAQQGKKVTIVEMVGQLMPESRNTNTILAVHALLAEHQVESLTNTKLLEVTKSGAAVEREGKRLELPADTIVIATGYAAELSVRDAVDDAAPEVVTVGDCTRSRNILNAIWEGFHAARVIE